VPFDCELFDCELFGCALFGCALFGCDARFPLAAPVPGAAASAVPALACDDAPVAVDAGSAGEALSHVAAFAPGVTVTGSQTSANVATTAAEFVIARGRLTPLLS
jgi:hypothetical protein